MGRRVDEWERQNVERRMLGAASYGPRQAAAKLEALKQAEAERLQLRTVPDNEPDNPLGDQGRVGGDVARAAHRAGAGLAANDGPDGNAVGAAGLLKALLSESDPDTTSRLRHIDAIPFR